MLFVCVFSIFGKFPRIQSKMDTIGICSTIDSICCHCTNFSLSFLFILCGFFFSTFSSLSSFHLFLCHLNVNATALFSKSKLKHCDNVIVCNSNKMRIYNGFVRPYHVPSTYSIINIAKICKKNLHVAIPFSLFHFLFSFALFIHLVFHIYLFIFLFIFICLNFSLFSMCSSKKSGFHVILCLFFLTFISFYFVW